MAQQVLIFFYKKSNCIRMRVVHKHKEIVVIGHTTPVYAWVHGSFDKDSRWRKGSPTTRSPHSRVRSTKWAGLFYTLRYVPTSQGMWLTVKWIPCCRFPRGRVERGSLKYSWPLRLLSLGDRNKQQVLQISLSLWLSRCLHSFSSKCSEWRKTPNHHLVITIPLIRLP